MHRFFVHSGDIEGNNVVIKGDDVNHISRVLRLREKDKIKVCNSDNIEYECEILSISKEEVLCKIISKSESSSEPNIKVTLFQGLPKAQKMDIIVQKCVEIGIYAIQPVITERIVVKLNGKDMQSKILRWNKIACEASKQSGRGIIPTVLEPIDFQKAVEVSKSNDLTIIPYENEKDMGIKKCLLKNNYAKSVGIFIGPEGGFDEKEIACAIQNSFVPVTLGPRILRTETAGFISSAFVLYGIGDMGGSI